MTTILEIALDYKRRGWQPIPVPHRSKNPGFSGWQNFVLSENELQNHFNGKPQNVGILLGSKSSNLIDLDLDSPEAVKSADFFLPETKSIFGRSSKPRSHRLFFSEFPKTEKFEYGETIVEIRSTGGQTIFPPSTHESGEQIEWFASGEPLPIEADKLRRAVALLASACVVTKFWTKQSHIRHDLSLAVSGALLRNGFSESETENFIRAVCFVCNDEEVADRLKSVETTAGNLRTGRNAFGFPKLAELTETKLVESVCKWLKIEKPDYKTVDEQKAQMPQGNGKSTFNFTTLDDLLSEPDEQHSYVWENTLISGGFSICSAKPKVGKSTLARNLAVCTIYGKPFLGRSTKKGKVIYLCLEEKRSEVAKHFRRMGISGKDILIHTGATPEDALRALEIAIAEFEPLLVIIDPLARVLRVKDFNDYGTMSRGLEPFIDLARKTNVHILALHHEGKGERDGGDALLGSTALFGAVDCHLQMRKRNNGRTLSTTQRYGEDLPETVIELDKDTGIISDKGDLQSYVLEQKKTEIFEAINDTEKITETEIKERVGGNSKGVISKALRLLLDEKQIYREGDGKRNNAYLYFKNLENEDSLEDNSPENEKPSKNADKDKVKSGFYDSGFLGFSSNENTENLENSKSGNQSEGQDEAANKVEFYTCPNCSAQIPMAEDFCQVCRKQAIDF